MPKIKIELPVEVLNDWARIANERKEPVSKTIAAHLQPAPAPVPDGVPLGGIVSGEYIANAERLARLVQKYFRDDGVEHIYDDDHAEFRRLALLLTEGGG